MEPGQRSRNRIAVAGEGAAHAVVLVMAAALFVWFVLTLLSTEQTGPVTPRQAQLQSAGAQQAANASQDSPIIYVYGPLEVVTALRADLSAAITAARLQGGPVPEVIIDGLDAGQRKVLFIDLR